MHPLKQKITAPGNQSFKYSNFATSFQVFKVCVEYFQLVQVLLVSCPDVRQSNKYVAIALLGWFNERYQKFVDMSD